MGCSQLDEKLAPDEETLQTWENMRVERLHDLQEGADADVPDSLIDAIGNLVVLDFWRAKAGLLRSCPWVYACQIKRVGQREVKIQLFSSCAHKLPIFPGMITPDTNR